MRSGPFRQRGVCLTVATLFLCAPAAGQEATPDSRPAPAPAGRVVEYAPGLRIDWARLWVELDAVVVLRQGPLELFACARQSKEHESIVAVRARPRRIFEALGLIGLEPGAPTRFDAEHDRQLPAHGAALRIDVVVQAEGAAQVCGIHEWMRPTGRAERPARRDWVFAGSQRLPGDRFAADLEGTIICVVDFETALMAWPEPHTSDDAQLWLEADPERIPPVGTPCVLRISSAERGRSVVEVRANGDLRRHGEPVSAEEVWAEQRAALREDPGANVVFVPEGEAGVAAAQELLRQGRAEGLDVSVRLPLVGPATQPVSRPAGARP
jgi:hypothetical protein